jgi:hypothetical protein
MTAVEFLIKELSKSIHFHRVLNEVNGNLTTKKDILNEALELEKEQIKKSYEAGCKDGDAIFYIRI